jgi:4-amino-4-deoxy-L-arabinose transferase-like glycosyltransferase
MTATLVAPPTEALPALPPQRRWRQLPPRLGIVAGVALLALVLVAVGLVTIQGLFDAPMRFDDEGTYVSQAIAVLHGHLAPYTYWYDHPPAGWIIIAGWMGSFGKLWHAPNPIATGRELMFVLNLAAVALLYVAARRLGLSRPAAAAAGLLFGLSPLAVSFHRMVLLDNVAIPLMLASVVLALSPKRRLGAAMSSGLSFGVAVLSKETVVLLAPFVLWLLWRNAQRATRRMSIAVFALAFLVPVVMYVLFALTRGELLPGHGHVSLLSGVGFQLFGRVGSGSVLHAGSDAHKTVTNWLSLDAWLMVVGTGLAVPALLSRRLRPVAAALLFLVLMILRPGYLPIPYVVTMLPLAALVAAGVVDIAVRRPAAVAFAGNAEQTRSRPVRALSAIAAVVALAASGTAVAQAEPHWRVADSTLEHADLDAPYQQATAWLRAHVPTTSTLLVDNVVWTDLRSHGYQQRHLVWFTKLGADPQVSQVAASWRSFNYVVSTEIMRTAPSTSRTTRETLSHAKPVAVFGSGGNRVVIEKVEK